MTDHIDPAPVGELIDAYYNLREQKRALNAEIKNINDDLERLKLVIIAKLDNQKLEGARGHLATGGIKETVVGTIKDYSEMENWIYRHKRLDLLEKRISSTAFRSILEERGQIPGVEPFTRRDLSVQVRSK